MRYNLMLSDGRYAETNFALIVINASNAGDFDALVVLKKNSSFHTSLDIDSSDVVIVDKYKKFLSKDMSLVTVDEEDIECPYLEYLNNHNLDGTKKEKGDKNEEYRFNKSL